MIDRLLGTSGGILIALAAMLAAWAIVRIPMGPRQFCRGPKRRMWARMLDIRGWVWPRPCGYELRDLPAGATCPECGRADAAKKALRRARGFRPEVAGILLGAIGAGCCAAVWIRTGAWASGVPTPVLVQLENAERTTFRRQARREIDRRLDAKEVRGVSARWLSDRLVVQLGTDEVHWNAERAESHLIALWPESREAVLRAFESDDVQARYFARRILRRFAGASPDEALLRASIADLGRIDGLRYYLEWGNGYDAAVLLMAQPPARVAPLLRDGMAPGQEAQQRLVCAAMAGHLGLTELLPEAAPILLHHCRENEARGDAALAAPALYRFGLEIEPYLETATHDGDAQLRGIAAAILERLHRPAGVAAPELDRLREIDPSGVRGSDPLATRSLLEGMSLWIPEKDAAPGSGPRARSDWE